MWEDRQIQGAECEAESPGRWEKAQGRGKDK